MFKIVTLCAILAFVHSEEQPQDDDTIEITLINYSAMYDNECSKSTTSAPAPSPDENNYEDANGYEHKYDKYYKDAEDKYDGSSNPGSVSGNEIGGDDDSNSENKESSTFCKCLAKVKKSGKSYADSQNDFSKCIDKANGNDAKHWERVAQKYAHKYGVKTDKIKSWNLPSITTTKAKDNIADDADIIDNTGKSSDSDSKSSDSDDDDNTFPNIPNTTDDDDMAMLYALDNNNDNRFGNAAIYITFIGASILLFICAWFIKDGMKKWKLREYEFVDKSSYESEADADCNGNPYGVNDDDWDDNYDSNYAKNNRDHGKKGKFAGWNQYSAV